MEKCYGLREKNISINRAVKGITKLNSVTRDIWIERWRFWYELNIKSTVLFNMHDNSVFLTNQLLLWVSKTAVLLRENLSQSIRSFCVVWEKSVFSNNLKSTKNTYLFGLYQFPDQKTSEKVQNHAFFMHTYRTTTTKKAPKYAIFNSLNLKMQKNQQWKHL